MSKKPKHGSNRGDSEDEYNDNEEDGQNENDFYICQNKPIASKLKKQRKELKVHSIRILHFVADCTG